MDGLLEKLRAGEPKTSLSTPEAPKSGERSLFKVSIIVGVTGLLSLTAGFLFRVGEFGYGMLAFVIWATILTIQCITLKYNTEILVAAVVGTAGLVLPFWGTPFKYWGATTLIIFLLLVLTHDRGKKEAENMLKIRFSHATRPVVGLILTIGVIMITFLFAVSGETLFTLNNVNRTVDLTIAPIMSGYIKDFSSEAKFGDVLRSFALAQIEKSPGSDELNDFQKQFLANQSAREMNLALAEQTNFTFNENQTVGENVHALVKEKTNNLLGEGSYWGILIIGALIFLLVKSIEIVLYIPLGLLSFMLYELLVAFGFVVVQSESRSKEIIGLL